MIDLQLPGVTTEVFHDLPTRTGDLTVHCSCTLHMSHPPVTEERRVLYTSFTLPAFDGPVLEHQRAVSEVREEAYKKVSQAPSPVARTAQV